ncbi:MAG: hypothetical protein IKB87_03150 [Clostridia bacterium]|nr:hypothetical protein [Clostridia bacterium]
MAEIRMNQSANRDTVCIDTYRVLDSCRDKDCFEDVRVYLTDEGQNILDRTCAVRVKKASVQWSHIDITPMPFNRGFYQLNIRIYCKIICEACVAPGNVREICGIAVVEKKVVLFGSEGNVNVFKSTEECTGFCEIPGKNPCAASTNLPIAVLETVDPLVLSSKVVEPHHRCSCPCSVDEIPDCICKSLSAPVVDCEGSNRLLVTLGFFSVVRLERPAQYLVSAVEYCVPEKECPQAHEDDPCSMFKKMRFPISEFCPPSAGDSTIGCSCEDHTKRSTCG